MAIHSVQAVASAQPGGEARAIANQAASTISAERMIADVRTLEAFGTRHTLSDQTSPTRGIGAAERWIQGEFQAAAEKHGRIQVMVDAFEQPPGRRIPNPVRIANVLAILPGSMPEAVTRHYLVMAHYDSRATDAMDATSDAPGANDNASGTAVVLELARALAGVPLDATVVFVATSGEEQGLYGATHLADLCKGQGWDVRGVLNNDIVGDPSAPAGTNRPPTPGVVRVFSEGVAKNMTADDLARVRSLSSESDSPSRQLARYISEVGELHSAPVRSAMVFRPDRFLRGGDHTPFNERGFAAVRFTEFDEDYSRQHVDVTEEDGHPYGDVSRFVDARYMAGVARLNCLALVHLANAPSSPARARVITSGLAADTLIRWSASPEPDVAGYQVVWRATTDPAWTGVQNVGLALEARIDLSKDDVFFGVRAYDKQGFMSPVTFCAAAAE